MFELKARISPYQAIAIHMKMLVLKRLLIEFVVLDPNIIMFFVADAKQLIQVILGVLVRAIL